MYVTVQMQYTRMLYACNGHAFTKLFMVQFPLNREREKSEEEIRRNSPLQFEYFNIFLHFKNHFLLIFPPFLRAPGFTREILTRIHSLSSVSHVFSRRGFEGRDGGNKGGWGFERRLERDRE